MSEIAVQEVTKIPDCERTNGSSSNGKLVNSLVENTEGKADKVKETMTSLVGGPKNSGDPKKIEEMDKPAPESTNSEVEYIESEKLKDVEDVENCVKTLLTGLDSKNWVSVCDALNDVRRLSIFHKESIIDMLSNVITLIVKSVKNPRSAVCKTAVVTSSDIFKAYNDDVIESLDPLLVQLLLKSSQDKKFVCEAADSALVALTSWVSPTLLLPKLHPYIKNRNPRIRAKASMCISRSVLRLGVEGAVAFGMDKLIQIGASQLSDQLPESRDAARALLLELKSMYEESNVSQQTDASEEPVAASWELFCQSKLSPLSAQAVLRVTTTARDGVVPQVS